MIDIVYARSGGSGGISVFTIDKKINNIKN
jgi:hypothetical protein